ncbi:MAG TPA: agmatine deiminase family protein [Gemmataceae bacterium]|jgi:agmatine deiminase|nr:agmatine deiminase family protein [Gemmataceae bacterium]
MANLPANLGYRMPAEWEPHEATWIAWPHERTDWPGKFAAIPWVFAEIVRHLHRSEQVNILVDDARREIEAKHVLAKVGLYGGERVPKRSLGTRAGKIDLDWNQIRFWRIPTDRGWMRDCGPIFITDSKGKLALTNWRFNGWAKYPNWKRDNAVPSRIVRKLKLPVWEPKSGSRPLVLEGGSIDVNGQGLLLTTEECLLSPVQHRNPGIERADLERAFADYLGIRKVLWLGQGIAGDDTHGHVDDLMRFVGPSKVVTVVEDDPNDANYRPLQENLDRLQSMTDLNGRRLEVVSLPMPGPLFFAKQRLPASYANFYIANDKVLVPTFNDPKDRMALGTLADLFPERKVVGIHAVDLVLGLGTLHCLTQQQPRVGR